MSNSLDNYPPKYLLLNQQRSKNLALVMEIEGIDTLFGISNTKTLVRYGDPNIVYGLPGLVYGGLRDEGSIKPYIVLDSSLTIQQKIEPESGKANIGTLTLTLIDKNGEVSRIITPGIVVDEIMMKREIRIWLGFVQTSFPDDFLLLYRGYITQVDCPPGLVKFQISDSNSKIRQPLFDIGSSTLTGSVDLIQTSIPIVITTPFFEKILGVDSMYDPTARTFIRVDDEIMEYSPSDVAPTAITVIRGSLGSSISTHDSGAKVTGSVQIGSDTGDNALTIALKILLSGWNGPCETGIELQSFVFTYSDAGFQSNAFVLKGQDSVRDLGLSVGDQFTITGATDVGNNLTGIITSFGDANNLNQIIYTDQTFTLENPTSALTDFRSQFDSYPIQCGLKLRPRDVDVSTFTFIRDTYFTADAAQMRFYFDEPIQGLDLLAANILLPIKCYGVSRFGRISLSITKPPLPGAGGKLLQLDWTNIIDPEKIHVLRSSNSRTFYNEISVQYSKNPLTGNFGAIEYFLDTESESLFNQTQVIPITAPGLQSDLNGAVIAQSTGTSLLNRFKKCALLIELTVNWSIGSLIEVSDIVVLRDEGTLKIMNFETGERNLGTQLFEVIDRKYNIISGNVSLKLLGGIGFNLDSRFGLISPSTSMQSGSTSTFLKITPSFGQTNINVELSKWTPYFGLPIKVHSYDWTRNDTTFLISRNSVDPTAFDVSPALNFTPQAGDIMEIADYPTSTDKQENQAYKALFAYITPTISVTSGVSSTEFNVSLSDAANITEGNTVIVRNGDYSVQSPEVKILTVVGTLVTVDATLGFTPSSSFFLEGIGFKDGTGYYRYD